MTKDLYELGDAPPLGTAPKQMYASLIRQERYGRPVDAFRTEVVDVPPVGPGQVLVKVMAHAASTTTTCGRRSASRST